MENRKPLILLVDDEEQNLRLMRTQLEAEGYRIATAADGPQALAAAAAEPPDLILLDVMLPGMDGFEVAERLKADARLKPVPIVMVTALADRESRLRGLQAGAEDFLAKPVDRAELLVRSRNLLKLKEYGDFLADYSRVLEARVQERSRQLTESYRETILALMRAAAYKDEETGAHVARISLYSVEIAAQFGLDEVFRDNIRHASPMHDIGKIAIPDAILGKADTLEAHEWQVMKTHAELGAKLLAGGNSPYLKMGAEIALSHHECWDGSGYPGRLRGEAIPFPARVMNVCDQYDALRSKRSYKPSLGHDEAVEIITCGDGRTAPGHFDPAVLDAFRRCTGRFRDIFEAHADER